MPFDIYESQTGIPHGSRVVTITRSGTPTTYIADNFSPSYPGKKLNQNDQLGRARRFKIARDFPTATATLQLESTTTVIPQIGEEIPADANDRVTKWVITDVSPAEQADAIRTVNITCQGVPLPLAP